MQLRTPVWQGRETGSQKRSMLRSRCALPEAGAAAR
jgi:hypothetical protein